LVLFLVATLLPVAISSIQVEPARRDAVHAGGGRTLSAAILTTLLERCVR
jgi:hypothetical protein